MEQMMKIFHSTPVPMLILDENLLVVKSNNAFSQFVGKKPSEVENIRIGKALTCENTYNTFMECGQGNLCPSCELQAMLEEVICTDKCIQNAYVPYYLMINNEPVSFNFRINAIPLIIDHTKYIAVMFLNLDSIKRNISFFEESLELFRKTFGNTIAFMWWIAADGQCVFVNNDWLKFTRRTIKEELNHGWMNRLHPDDRAMVEKSVQAAIDNNDEYNIEFRALRFDGEYRWINVTGRPQYGIDGQLSGYICIGFDVTEKRLKWDALEKYKLLSESVNDIILYFDKYGNILEANNSAVKAYKYAYEELLSLNVSDIRADTPFHKEFLEKVNQGGATYEVCHKRKDGSKFPVEVSINSALINKKELYIAVIRDISRRKEAERKTQESENRYYSLFKNMAEAFLYGRVVCDDKGKPIDFIILEVNNAFEKITGFNREEVLNKRAFEVFPGIKYSEPDLIKVCGHVALTGEEAKFELKMNHSGKFYSVSSYSPQFGSFIIVFYDISEQKHAELQIKKLSMALEQSSAMVLITDTEGYIEYINSKFTQVAGYSLEEIRGKHISIIAHEKVKEKLHAEIWSKVSKGEQWNGESLSKKKNGELYWVYSTISPVRDKNRVITNYILIQDDITERKLLEKELKLNNKKLKKAVKELRTMQELLIQQEKLAGIGQLAAGVAHEINNPLGYVMSNFDILRKYSERVEKLIDVFRMLNRYIKNEDYSMVVKYLQLIDELEEKINFDDLIEELFEIFEDCNEGLRRIKNIVSGLSVFARFDQQQEFKDYNINEGIENTLIVAHNNIKYHAEVRKEFENVPVIQAIGDQINQVLLNIIVNAAQAIAAKNRESKGLIIIKTYYDNKHVYCEITDDGIGISKENIKKIYNPFYTTKSIGEGMGLGLSISYNIITNVHKGQLMVISEEGKGTTFTLKLPINNK